MPPSDPVIEVRALLYRDRIGIPVVSLRIGEKKPRKLSPGDALWILGRVVTDFFSR